MLQVHANKIRSRLRLTASILVVAASFGASAQAAQTILTTSNTPWVLDGDTTVTDVVIQSGKTGYLTASYNAIPAGYLGIVWNAGPQLSSTGSCAFGGCFATSDIVNVASGGKVIVDNPWGWQPFQSIFNVTGDAEFMAANWGGGQTILMGTNTFLGNLTVDAGFWGSTNTLQVGQDWSGASIVFGPNTNVILQDSTLLEMWTGGSSTTIGGTVSGAGNLTLHGGALGINGINTVATSYKGTVTIDGGAGIVIGDVTHQTAVFGDLTGSTAVINIGQGGGALGTLKGYGTIWGKVNNNGSVTPGGTAGTLGTLSIHGTYTQTSLGQLVVEVTPTGTSKLAVSGAASVSGSLIVKVDSGTYTTPALYSVLSTSALTGSFSTVSVQGSSAFVGAVRTSTGYQVAVESANSPQTLAHQQSSNRYNVAAFNRALYDQIATPSQGGGEGGKAVISTWLTPFTGIENVGRAGIGYSNTEYGVRGGLEVRPQARNAVIGIAASYGSGSMDVKGEGSTSESNTYNLALYGGADLLNGRLDGTIFYSAFDAAIKRDLSTNGTALSDPQGNSWGASIQLSKSLYDDTVTPYFRAIYTAVHLDASTETGNASFALAYDRHSENTMLADLGVRVHAITPKAGQPVKLDFTLAVEHDFSNKGESLNAVFANISGSSAAYKWKGDAENALLAGIDFSDQLTDKLALFARLDGQFSTNKRAGDFSVGAKYRF